MGRKYLEVCSLSTTLIYLSSMCKFSHILCYNVLGDLGICKETNLFYFMLVSFFFCCLVVLVFLFLDYFLFY